MDKLEHILNKLRKLMDLQNSARECGQEGEANAAAAGISRLLAEYDLTLQDIPSEVKPQDPVDIERIEYQFKYTQHRWYWNLLDVVAKHNNCTIVCTRAFEKGKQTDKYYSIIGRKKNREVSLYLISFLVHKFIHIGQRKYPEWKIQYIRQTGRMAPSIGSFMKDYLKGCVVGLNEKMEEQKKTLPEKKMTALVVTNGNAIAEFMKNMKVKQSRERSKDINGQALAEGYKTGKNVEIQQGLEQKNNQLNFLK